MDKKESSSFQQCVVLVCFLIIFAIIGMGSALAMVADEFPADSGETSVESSRRLRRGIK